ncbi:MAG: glycosyltransferase [Nanoarchaeota archaeon]|nr:glycosyltransferase [Nanoarchaeota archaeon]
MISIIITAYKEEKTIGRAIESILQEKIKEKVEIIVICPDKPTADVVKEYQKKHKSILLLKDKREGKPAALNQTFKKAKGDIIILTDGDVYIEKDAIKNLIMPFKDKNVGAVCGRPISTNSRDTMLGYWSHLLTDVGAHETRLRLSKKGKFIVCSGYLYAIRSGIVNEIPLNSLSDDAVISSMIAKKGYKIQYSPKSLVYVKYPSNFKDWMAQKKRSTGGYLQIKELSGNNTTMRSFSKEASNVLNVFSYSKNIKEFLWTIILILVRLYMWLLIFYDQKIKKKSFEKIWVRIESTK